MSAITRVSRRDEISWNVRWNYTRRVCAVVKIVKHWTWNHFDWRDTSCEVAAVRQECLRKRLTGQVLVAAITGKMPANDHVAQQGCTTQDLRLNVAQTRKKIFCPPGTMCWTSFKTTGHSSKILGPSQENLRPSWCLKLVTSLTWHRVDLARQPLGSC